MSPEQLQEFEEQGLLFVPSVFSAPELDTLRAELPVLLTEDSPSRVFEKDKKTVRALHGCHLTNEVCRRLTRHPQLLNAAKRILRNEVYVYQFKVNCKAALTGDVWPWHQDFIFWRNEDGMHSTHVINVAIFIDEVNEFNGPMYFIPGSHKAGVVDVTARRDVDPEYSASTWVANVSADLKYSLDQETIARLVTSHGMVAPKGPPGSVLFFHSNIAHCSASNISPFNRTLIVVTYNSVDNIPVPVGERRPEFLVSRDYTPLTPLDENALLTASSQS